MCRNIRKTLMKVLSALSELSDMASAGAGSRNLLCHFHSKKNELCSFFYLIGNFSAYPSSRSSASESRKRALPVFFMDNIHKMES